jgi:glutamate dehydrogenase
MAARKTPADEGESASHLEPGTAPAEAQEEAQEAAAHLSASAQLIGSQDPGLAGFFAAFTRYASPEDLVLYTGAELAALVRLIYAKATRRAPGTALVEAFVPRDEDREFSRGETVILAVNDDMPFLFDSATAEVLGHGMHIRTAFHPVIATPRDASGRRTAHGKVQQESVIVLALEHAPEKARIPEILAGLTRVFDDVRTIVRDWRPMVERLRETAADLALNPPPIAKDELEESLAFLEWLADDHFTFLGSRDYDYRAEGQGQLVADFGSGLGILANPEMRVIRRGEDRVSLTPDVREFLTQPSPLIITKSNSRASVHRRVHMDYIGVKRFDSEGRLKGERRFVGLFTSVAYSQLPADIPLLRRKVAQVLAGSGLPAKSHDGKALAHILNVYPRDELFQIQPEELLATALGILSLGQRPKVRVFLRFDRFDRYVSALVFLPRDRYNRAVREKIHAILARTFDGRTSAAYTSVDEENLARLHFIVGRNPGPRPQADVKELEDEIREAIRTWEDAFAEAAETQEGQSRGAVLIRRFGQAFPVGYREAFTPVQAVNDIEEIETLLEGRAPGGTVYARADDRRPIIDEKGRNLLRLKLFVRGDYVPLSDVLPVFENLGLRVVAEDAFGLKPLDENGRIQRVGVQNFLLERSSGGGDQARLRPLLEEAFHAVWLAHAESDGFNRLVIEAELDWRDVSILRAIAKFLRQAGITFSQTYMEAALAKNPSLATMLIDLFYSRHDPSAFTDPELRARDAEIILERIDGALEAVPSADEDRIIRAFAAVIEAMLRTNFFQRQPDGSIKPALAFKLDSTKLDLVPAPRPFAEISIYSPEVEGVHLRFGPVARGGIRWSDRAEDFRTEILGLVKAQQVKNAVIVPVGAKGGFYPKRLPRSGTREEIQTAGIAAYRTFIGALLDLTDNIAPDGTLVPPPDVFRHDDDDPYLVVAADKGTASFSDIANEIAESRGFWLGDAFAAGGSHGYNHKSMGITARGAWEAVKRHFRELGRDIQDQDFTVTGVGDMSGDVFGNGMLLSRHIRLVGAFDHRHIFFDPNPDPAAGWAERKRLFDLPRSSWADYDKNLISAGGGVFPRNAKEIYQTKEMRSFTGSSKANISPQELIRAILTAKTDLLFFGGIGTFVKSSAESATEVGDRANDAIRVDGSAVRASVIGEGANLGVTQLGRVEFAREGGPTGKGGRINTDAIDNSAGVDTSDHEVNLKILMSGPVRRHELDSASRDALLTEMTDDVAQLVLKDNYDQTLAISVAERSAVRDLDAASRLIRDLERSGKIDRAIEKLPDDEHLRILAREGRGLTRPELAVLLAHAKLDLQRHISGSDLPDDPFLETLLHDYFPLAARQRFAAELPRHRLKREIIATQLTNRTVNLAGPLFVHRMRELTSAPSWCAARAFALADGAFGLSALKERIDALDLVVAADDQNAMMTDIVELLRRLGHWFIVQLPASASMTETVATFGAGVTALRGRFSGLASMLEARTVERRIEELRASGVPEDVAEDVAALPLLGAVPEIVLLAESRKVPVDAAAGAYFRVGATVGFDRVRILSSQTVPADHWDRLALRRVADDLYAAQRLLASDALADVGDDVRNGDRTAGAAAVRAWAATRRQDIERTHAFLEELERAGTPTIAKLALAGSQVQKLAVPR